MDAARTATLNAELLYRQLQNTRPETPEAPAPELEPEPAQEVALFGDRKTCSLCMENFKGVAVIAAHFPYQCNGCTQNMFCRKCLKEWFIDACRNESKMPPKCCLAIPPAVVAGDLSLVEINLYKAKYEEWSTADRIYCPIPTCSTFIPPRHYIHLSAHQFPNNNKLTLSDVEVNNAQTLSTTTTQPSVTCPTCQTPICTSCRSQTHTGPCPLSDLSLEMQEALSRLNIKRCPKCRAGIRKMFGCSHVACLCGAHFCWGCLEPIEVCGGACGDGDDEDEEDANDNAAGDLDAGAYDGNGCDFGDEPVSSTVDQWGCVHRFVVEKKLDATIIGRYQQGECRTCFRSLTFSGLEEGTYTGWECENCGQQICGPCRSARRD